MKNMKLLARHACVAALAAVLSMVFAAPGRATDSPPADATAAHGPYLSGISLSAGRLTSAFKPKVFTCRATLGENDAEVTVTPVKADAAATMTIDGELLASKTLPLANGASATMTIQLSLGDASNTYTLTITRAKSTDSCLSALEASAGALAPAFKPTVTRYTLTLSEDVGDTVITAQCRSSLASVSPATLPVTLDYGASRTVKIKVKAQSGAVKTYTVTVKRTRCTNADLSGIALSGASCALAPGFSSGRTYYSVRFPTDGSKLTVSATAAGAHTKVSIDGTGRSSKTVKPKAGQKILLHIAVTAQAGGSRTYTVAVNPPEINNQAWGLDYSPYIRKGQDPNKGSKISDAQIRETLEVLAPYTRRIRTYGCTGSLADVASIAHGMGFEVSAGAWLGPENTPEQKEANEAQINKLIQIAQAGDADVLIVGSEALYRGDLSESQLIAYIDQVKAAVGSIPVTTADITRVFLDHPNVISHIDCIYANIHPYWEGTDIDSAIGQLDAEYGQLVSAASGKQVVISETGWPDAGNDVPPSAVPNPANAAAFFAQFMAWANQPGHVIPYFYFEAFDEPWKGTGGNPQEAHWGVWGSDEKLKPLMGKVFTE